MATAGYAKKVSANISRKQILEANFPVGKLVETKTNGIIEVCGYWGDRCFVGSDNNIYNTDYDVK